MLVDIGANLTHDSFDPDRDEVIARATQAGVAHMVVTGSDVQQSAAAATLASEWPDCLSATAGIHPHHAREMEADSISLLQELAQQDKVVAIGECGLDYFRNFSPRKQQLAAFEAQLDLAARLQMPVFLHQRDAHEDFLPLLRSFRDSLLKGVAHCFTGTQRELHDYLDLDLHVGITGWICDERRGTHLREFVGDIPTGRLMIETDAPYLLPRDLKPRPASRRNEPCYLPHILAAIAASTGQDETELASETTKTACEFFGIEGL